MTDLSLAPVWRAQPYRVFFPLGVLLAWGGVVPWLLFGLGVGEYRPQYHAFTQIQGFMACFALGFLFTMIPRRTGTMPPAPWEMVIGLTMPVGTVVAAWGRSWVVSQICWLVLVGMLLSFAIRRFRAGTATRRPPNSFVWVPIAILMGLCGSVMIAASEAFGVPIEVELFGRLLLLQGTFLGLVLGVGGMVLPLMTCGDAPPDGTPHDRSIRLGHLGAAATLLVSFVLEARGSLAVGVAIRAVLVAVVLVVGARIYRMPRRPGWHRWLIWLSGWMIPIGYTVAAIWPFRMPMGLHVVFLGGFGLMALSVGLHVTLAHDGRSDLVSGRPWQVPVFGLLLGTALVFRALVQMAPERTATWLVWSASSFLLATLVWATLAIPSLIPKPVQPNDAAS